MVQILYVKKNDADSGISLSTETETTIENLSSSETLTRLRENRFDSERLVVIQGQAEIGEECLSAFIDAAIASGRNIASAFPINDGRSHRLEELSIAGLIPALRTDVEWPIHLLFFDREILSNIGDDIRTLAEALARIVIQGVSEHASIDLETTEIKDGIAAEKMLLSAADCRAALHFAVNSINIEELFPNHSWENHQEESAAACYHTLAARFITLRDYTTAQECLAYGDRLEDSPRSLALKGFIALKQGETLTAVANMVSSLQEYEKRKKDAGSHYLSFQPRDLEKINTSLESGLQELNKRNNSAAANHFVDAVLNFDSFFEESGLDIEAADAQSEEQPVN